MKLLFETTIEKPFEIVRNGFTEDLFLKLAPGFIPSELIRFDGCKKGHEVHLKVGPPPAQLWVSIITSEGSTKEGWSFVDEGKVLPWPLRSWKHHHRVDRVTATSCKIVDDITYECTLPLLSLLLKPILVMVFGIRPKRYKKYFEGIP